MRLSELNAMRGQYDRITALRDERRDLGELLNAIDEGCDGEVSCVFLDNATELRPAARPALREAVAQSLQVVEAELQGLGVEIDEPAFGCDEDDDDDEEDGE